MAVFCHPRACIGVGTGEVIEILLRYAGPYGFFGSPTGPEDPDEGTVVRAIAIRDQRRQGRAAPAGIEQELDPRSLVPPGSTESPMLFWRTTQKRGARLLPRGA